MRRMPDYDIVDRDYLAYKPLVEYIRRANVAQLFEGHKESLQAELDIILGRT